MRQERAITAAGLVSADMAYDLPLVRVEVVDGIAIATIDNPPINLMTLELFAQPFLSSGKYTSFKEFAEVKR